ncbi:Asp-tRNA(Asn)/Glu-tRNA(Gln) amidotransferase A subunit family amidase [Paraburkholderia caballeronis]|uniref:amidase n=1 Tax=Paraburkholderia caballeronis TaxID=416943 RepID=UPI0010658DEA|nr:amidase [Paraburkholderia caballeronis]TDV33652.1 Asp-tRNA(Asn)/Glu-tRNA(Gln) amidotransferase A subunit family amidase [Paraburkholderia caballeronis]
MNTGSFYQPLAGLALRRRIDGGSLDAARIVLDALDRIDEVDREINAMTAVVDREEASAAAASSHGPLAGLPVAVKDIFDTADLPTGYGSPIYTGHRPAADAAIVTLLRRAGAVVVGKTTTSEFAYMSPTVTRNPCDSARTPGGSSAGSAAAVAAGMVPFAIGSQTGGSTIRPASFCGVAGFKPTPGLLPTVGMKCFSWSLDTVGLFAASVRDAAFLAQALAGRPLAVTALPDKPVFGVPLDYPWSAPSGNALAALDTAVRAIGLAGGSVKSVRFDAWMADLIGAHHTIQSYEAWRSLGYEYDNHRDELSPLLRAFLERAATVDAEAYQHACVQMRRAREQQASLFDGVTALLMPAAPDEAPEGLGSTGDPAFNRNWTLLGNPCTNVPGLRGHGGAPIGLQVVCSPGSDSRCLSAAAFVEHALAQLGREGS